MQKTNHVKKYGLRPILVDFIMGMKELENPGFYINNLSKVKGRLLFTTNDNPAAGLLSGTKESAGLSKRICCTCLISNEDAKKKKKYKLNPAERWSQAEHLWRCELIEQARTNAEKSVYSKEFGINERSVFLDIAYINIPMHIVHDILHVTLEYSDLDMANKPQELTKINVEKLSLKQAAITALLFAYILPHIIGEKIETFLENSPRHEVKDIYLNYLNLINVIILCTSNYIDHDTPAHYLFRLWCLTPGMHFTPKCHYLQHVPEQLRRFWPGLGTWTLRFEVKHSEFKANKLMNFKNTPKT